MININTPPQAVQEALLRAVEYAGSYQDLAILIRATGGATITKQGVHHWHRLGIPAERALEVERATNGYVKRYELRPDLYDAA